jgi:hypothetical protein
MKKKKLVVLGLALGLLATAGAAQAGYSYEKYDTQVGAFNGSGYSSYQTKAKGGAYATLISSSVGGSYTVDARETGHSGPASWRRDVTDSKTYSLPSIQSAGYDAIVQFSNDLNTPVNVRVTGSWASN